jgi:hypothetical protein
LGIYISTFSLQNCGSDEEREKEHSEAQDAKKEAEV